MSHSEKKLQIIRAASKRFTRHGLKKTTLDEIARDLRIGKATLYHYFESKENLYTATIEWESELFLEKIKFIFNNEEQPVGIRLIEYFTYKESASENYKMLYDLMLTYLNDSATEIEMDVLRKFLHKEQEIVKLILSSIYSGRIESMNPDLPHTIVLLSWSLTLGLKLNSFFDSKKTFISKDILFKVLESVLV